MLIKCPECNLQVSDKAVTCPHCGYPLKPEYKRKERKSNRKKRLPNGFGQITELKDRNLRKPFRAMVTVGKNSEGRPICKLLKPEAYFQTYNEAYEALLEYNKNPYNLGNDIRMYELFEKWSDQHFKELKSASSIRTIMAAWAYFGPIKNIRVKDIRVYHLKNCIDSGTANINGEVRSPSPETKSRMKTLMNQLFDYAMEYELVEKNYARMFQISGNITKEINDAKREHIPFTSFEIKKLWENINVPYVNLILYQCYSGWRPQEIGLIEIANVDLKKNIIIGGMKTEAGTNRIVPIHPLFHDFIAEKYKEAVELGSKYLFNCTDSLTHRGSLVLTYDKYSARFEKVIKILDMNSKHRPHDPRKHFITMAKKYNLDEYAIKYIVGHDISDITEKVYTERDPKWLYEEICKIK